MLVLGLDSNYRELHCPGEPISYDLLPQKHSKVRATTKEKIEMKTKDVFRTPVTIAALFFSILLPVLAQIGPELQIAELSKKLQLNDQQKKELAPKVELRDKEVKALRADTSMGKLQKLRKAQEIQTNFRNEAAKVLNPDQLKKFDALQAERRAKLMGH